MSKKAVIAFVVLGGLAALLAVTVAWNGSKLDAAREERDDLQFEVDDLRQEVDTLSGERDELQKTVDEHLKTIEQLKAAKSSPAADAAPAPAPAAP